MQPNRQTQRKTLPLFFIKNIGEILIETHLIATGILTWRLPTEHYASHAVVSRSTVTRTRTSEAKSITRKKKRKGRTGSLLRLQHASGLPTLLL